MIEVKITNRGIRMKGHAGRMGSDGIDRACTAVSALTCNLINAIESLTEDRIESGYGQRIYGDPVEGTFRTREAAGRFLDDRDHGSG